MARLKEITEYLDELLNVTAIPGDSSNNGLQVEAAGEVDKAVFGVDACKALFEGASLKNADLVFVHHGISWGAEPRRFTGIIASRLELLFKNGISLYAAHLPLDAHPEIGHNALLADMVNLQDRYSFMEYCGSDIGCGGILQEPCFAGRMAGKLEKKLNCKAEIFGSRDKKLEKAGIVSGGGGMDALMAGIGKGMDCLITGEMDHTMYHFAKESGMVVIALGHYRSETPGVLAVMDKVRKKFDIDCEFIDIPTGL